MIASYSTTSDQLEDALAGSGWNTLSLTGEALYYNNPLLISPVNAFAARNGSTVAIAFQGTNEGVDWLSNIGGGIFSWAPLYHAYDEFFTSLSNYLSSAAGAGVTKVLVTGHSQGAAMVEYFLSQQAPVDARVVGVAFASPGIDQNLDYLGSQRLIRIEHSNDIVVDAAQRTGPLFFQDNEFDLKVILGESESIQGIAEHDSFLYVVTARTLFMSQFGQEILTNYQNIQAQIGFETGQSMYGGAGRDVIFGKGGADTIYGGGSRDLIDGGDGIDKLIGEGGNDELRGGGEADTLFGGGEVDYLYGDDGDDHLIGEGGNDYLDGGVGNDTAHFALSFQNGGGGFNYELIELGGGSYRVRDLTSGSPDGTDTLERIEYVKFGSDFRHITEWAARAGVTAPAAPNPVANTPYYPTSTEPDTPDGVSNSLLSVTPINRQLTVGQPSIALSDLFPSSLWVDNDGLRDIVRFAVQDRTAGGGYLTYLGKAVAANEIHEMPVSDLANWRFVAASGAATDNIGFNIIQTDGDFSPRLATGAVVTTVAPVSVVSATPTPIVVSGTEVARLDLDLRNGSSGDEGDSAQFTIERRGNQQGDIIVEWRIEGIGDQPADRRDFSSTSGTVTLYDGRGDRNFSIGIAQDKVDELNETFRVELRIVSGNAVLDDDDANFTIIDDDAPLGINPNVDDHGNSFESATEVREDTWARGFVEQPGDKDYFQFDLLGGVGYEFILIKDDDLSLIGGDPNANYVTLAQPITELYNASGQLIATLPATSLSTRWAFQYETPADGTYYLRVRENGDNDVGQYFVQADVRVRADDFAASSATTGYLAVNSSLIGHHERSTDVDWIAVDLVAGQNYRMSLFSDNRLEVDNVNGSNGFYFFGWDRAGFSLVNASGSVVAARSGAYPTSSNLLEFEASLTGRYYVVVDGTTGQMNDYVVNLDVLADRPTTAAKILQPGPAGIADYRFGSIYDGNSPAIDDEVLTVNNGTSSVVKFDLTGQSGTASYAAIELFMFASTSTITGDVAIDVPLNALGAGSKFGDVGSIEFITAVQTSGTGKWVTFEITDLYNQWISGERANNGIILSTTEFSSALMSFHSSNYAGDVNLRPRLVLDGPDILQSVYGDTTGAIAEDDGSISGSIGLTGGGFGFGQAVVRGSWGTLTVDPTGRVWTYALDARSEELRSGQTVIESLVLTANEGVSQAFRITITGRDDGLSILGAGIYSIAEANDGASGKMALADVDALVQPTFVAATRTGNFGQLSIQTDGTWAYVLSNAGKLTLDAGDTGVERFALATSDGTGFELGFDVMGSAGGTSGMIFTGTTGADTFTGTAFADVIEGLAGDDTLNGDGGDDTLLGGAGADTLDGGPGSNTVDGGDGDDLFRLEQGANDTAIGGTGNDAFYFGAAFSGVDSVDGGVGTRDQIGLQGSYAGGVSFGTNVTGIEQVILLPGSDTRFGDVSGAFYSYAITTGNAAIAAGAQMVFQANILRSGENFTLDASGEVDGSVFTYGGQGNDLITGSQGSDAFFFGTARFGSGDVVNGQGGALDSLGLQGNYAGASAVSFGAGQLIGVEQLVFLSNSDTRFGGAGSGTPYNYTITTHDGNVAADARMIIQANTLVSDEVLNFNGSAELDGVFSIFSGNGADTLRGGAGNDTISGRGGADMLLGGGGNDTFLYTNLTDSTPGTRDTFGDFSTGDLIDLSRLDAITGGANDAFSFIGDAAFTNTAGQLRAVNTGANNWLVEADTNGDSIADFALFLTVSDNHPITVSDFLP